MVTIQYTIDVLSQGLFDALIALGLALPFGILGMVNFAYSGLIAGGAYAIFYTEGIGWVPAAVLGVLCATALSVLLERTTFRPLRGKGEVSLLVTSFAGTYLIEQILSLVSGSGVKVVTAPTVLSSIITAGSLQVPVSTIFAASITLVVGGALAAFLKFTPIGVDMRAAAEDQLAAQLMGVRTSAVLMMSFLITGLIAGLVAMVYVVQLGALDPSMGTEPLLVAFVAIVLAGRSGLLAAVIGGFALGVCLEIVQIILPSGIAGYRDAVVYGLVLAVMMIRPRSVTL